MPILDSTDGTRLAYHETGDGDPLVCLPGGPMRASTYLGDLGGLDAYRRLVLLDLRGTGESAAPVDPSSYRCDRQVADVEALRQHLGLNRLDIAAHSAGATLALLYATRHPERIGRLALVCPSPRAVGLEVTESDRREVALRRQSEPWFPAAFAALTRIWSGEATEADWDVITPFSYGRWDAASHADAAATASQGNDEAAAVYYAEGAVDPAEVRAAIARLDAPVLLVAGEYDVGVPPSCLATYAGLFARAELVVQPGAGHSPWLDDPESFTRTMGAFLA
jgi:pimeloyl-ACP methyl ester carboxylesterase